MLCLVWSLSHGCWKVVSHHQASTRKPGDDRIIVGPWRVMVSVLKHYIGPDGLEMSNNSFHLLCSLQSLEPTDSHGCVRSLSSSSFVSFAMIVEYSKYLRVIAGIGLITCSLEFLQCIFCSQRSHTTLTSCQAVNWQGLSQWLCWFS